MKADSIASRISPARTCISRERTRGASRGYILLTVIAVSVLVVTALSGLATLSLRRGLEASDAEQSLQQRWGALTLERALLSKAPRIFQLQEDLYAERSPGVPPPATIRDIVNLRGVTFDLLLGDEDSKLNLNAVYHHSGPERTQNAVSRVAGPFVSRSVRLIPAVQPMQIERQSPRLSTSDEEDESSESTEPPMIDAFRSWGEVFDLKSLDAGLARDASLPNLTLGLTCWGNGQLNFRRASDEAILAVARCVVQDGAARRLLQRYRKSPTATLDVLLQVEVANQRDRESLMELMSETSTDYSIWIDAASRGGGSLRSFAVTRRDDEGATRQVKFRH